MNTPHKSLKMAFLAVSIFILGFSRDFVDAQGTAVSSEAFRPPSNPLLSRYLRFGRLTTKDGLLSDQTRNVVQDKRGFLWFATLGGLNRYDGASLKVYRHDPDDPNSLSHDIVRTVYEDRAGKIWVGTMAGLNKLDRNSGQFTRYQHDPGNLNSLSNNIIWSVIQDSTGVLWVGTENGLNRFDP